MAVVGVILFLIFAFALVWALVEFRQDQKKKESARKAYKESARKAYLESLASLKISPTNADRKQKTLTLGRHYASLTRDANGNTLFDEVALMNDINAACAAANVPTPVAGAHLVSTEPSFEARLTTLGDLKAKGLVDSAEYEKRRNEILNSI
ncbi:SHOCT domain-containing protein [Armatimonas sp.]|uniref:SHOCT domain-containing protein n=1 Tax=Armatimonas sp. TaxID=1872638 RepID=UPI00374CCA4F